MILKKEPLVILTGPTAAGKTALSIALAKKINGEIISADSMQVYKGMDIGSAKITKEEQDGVRHYLIDILEPDEPFDVARFQAKAKEAVKEIRAKGKIPIVVGGTGFYIQALLYDIDFQQNEEEHPYRRELEAMDTDTLFAMLTETDPESARTIHANNRKRVIRALEYFKETGEKISLHNEREKQKEAAYNSAYFVLTDERPVLYERINQRVDLMVRDGLVEEVRALHQRGFSLPMVSMQGLGYKEVLAYLDGKCTLEEAIDTIKQETRHFAKRQLTWFRREKEVIWIEKQKFDRDEQKILDHILKILEEKRI